LISLRRAHDGRQAAIAADSPGAFLYTSTGTALFQPISGTNCVMTSCHWQQCQPAHPQCPTIIVTSAHLMVTSLDADAAHRRLKSTRQQLSSTTVSRCSLSFSCSSTGCENLYSPEVVETAENKNLTNFN